MTNGDGFVEEGQGDMSADRERSGKFWRDRRVMVTGRAGFIGSHIGDELVRRGEHVRGRDNFSTGHIENLAEARPHTTAVGRPHRRTYRARGGGIHGMLRLRCDVHLDYNGGTRPGCSATAECCPVEG